MGSSVQEILKMSYASFRQQHRMPGYVHKAAQALIECRTSALGGHVQACPEGHYQRHWYNSCRNRMCPQCNWLQIEQWLRKQSEKLLKCGHYHMIFTIPHELHEIWRFNKKRMTNILFTAVRDTLFELFLDERHIGGKPGIIAALHTWTQTQLLHPHIHCLITEGGLSEDGQWKTRNNGYLLPVRAVMAVYRGKLLAYIDKAIEKGQLKLPDMMSRQRWKNMRNKLGRVKWNVNIRERYEYGKGVLTYLSRYIRGGAISNRRIESFNGSEVSFRYRLGEKNGNVMTLPVADFLTRYFQHVPEANTKVVRYYGLYAPTAKTELADCRAKLGQSPVKETTELDWQTYSENRGRNHAELCPVCGRRLVRLDNIPRDKVFSGPGDRYVRQAA
ncbi:MAG: IS91 family transposase [Nitrospirae bacterium]|nr:IS91 family transposase [Nitrospirota bacterium]